MKRVLHASVMLVLCAGSAAADQTVIANYNAVRPIFWDNLYANGGFTLYCAQPFSRKLGLDIEHVYPASWMLALFPNCTSRSQCRSTEPRFNHMEADLHNLWPARCGTNRSRSNRTFGEVTGELRDFGAMCDFEVDTNNDVAEPPPAVRGEIARSVFYMHSEYQLPINATLLPLLKTWNNDDPPSAEERRRNDAIQAIQNTRNSFIDQPALGDAL